MPTRLKDNPDIGQLVEDMFGREKFLLYGQPKTGKTFCALTSPQPIYFLQVGGFNEIKTYYGEDFQKKHGVIDVSTDWIREDIDKMGRVKTPQGFDNVCRALDEALELDEKETFPSDTSGFSTLVVDNASMLSWMAMNKTIKIANTSRSPDAEGYSTWQAYMEHGMLAPFDSDWKGEMSLMDQFTNQLFDLNKNVVFIAHEYEVVRKQRKGHTEEVIGVKPQFVGKNRTKITNRFDNVWRFSRSGQLFVARTVPGGEINDTIAGSRIGGVVKKDYSDPNITATVEKFRQQALKVAGGK